MSTAVASFIAAKRLEGYGCGWWYVIWDNEKV